MPVVPGTAGRLTVKVSSASASQTVPAPPAVEAAALRLNPLGIVVLVLLYCAAGKIGLAMASVHASASPVWAPTGIAMAAFLLYGRAVWPTILLGAFLVNITTAGTAATSLGIAIGNTLEGLLAGLLVQRYAGGARVFDRPQDVFKFVALAAAGCTALSATIGVTSLALGGAAAWADFWTIWRTWWLGDATGALLVTPLVVLWVRKPRPGWSGRQAAEAAALLVVLVAVGSLVFRHAPVAGGSAPPLMFLALPPLIWAAFRFGPRETVAAACLLSGIAVWGTLRQAGPFPEGALNESLLLLQVFLAVKSVTAVVLAALVAEHRRAHAALAARGAELTRSNTELEQFAYSASHDLREPLRMVISFLQLIEQRYRGRLDADADDFIRLAVDGAKRMQALIEDLLAYSRAGRSAADTMTESARALDEALANLGTALRESRARVTRGVLPPVAVDGTRLVQLFQNLVGNAIKYRGDAEPEIHVDAARRGEQWLLTVRDNGIGIAPDYQEKIFGMFQRLHSRERYPGTGMGLPICRRIVEAAGGRIWMESAPGKGAIFFFTLPAQVTRAAAPPADGVAPAA